MGLPPRHVDKVVYTTLSRFYVQEKDGRIVGMIHVRHYFNDFLWTFGGHIGDSVRPSERRKGYATSMLHD